MLTTTLVARAIWSNAPAACTARFAAVAGLTVRPSLLTAATSLWTSPVKHYGVLEPSFSGFAGRKASLSAVPHHDTSMHTTLLEASTCQPVVNQATVTASEMQASATGGFSTGVTTQPSGQGFKKTFYKRKLPSPPSIAFACDEGRQLFAEALASGHMNGFFKLMEQFSTQDEPSFCGLASLAMVLNALAIDPRRTWKGAWRWFHEQMLDCCRPLEDVKREGITLPQAACLSRCNGARVVLHRHGTFTEEDLRQQVLDVCSSGEQHLVVSYSRRTFLQTGDGHFSPIGGYHAGKDLVLILDVHLQTGRKAFLRCDHLAVGEYHAERVQSVPARFKYPPHWVPLPMLYDAMKYPDPVTGQPRGFLRMSAQPLLTSVLLTLDVRSSCWQHASDWVRTTAPAQLQAAAAAATAAPAEQLIATLLASLPPASLDAFLMLRHNVVTQGANGNTSNTVNDIIRHSSPLRTADAAVAAAADASTAAGAATRGTSASVGDPVNTVKSVWDHGQGRASSPAGDPPERCLPVGARQQLLRELRALPLFGMVQRVMQQSGQLSACTQLTCRQHNNLSDASLSVQTGSGTQRQEIHSHTSQVDSSSAPSRVEASASSTCSETSHSVGRRAGAEGTEGKTGGCCQPPVDDPHLRLREHAASSDVAAAAGPAAVEQPLNSGYLAEKATVLLLLLREEGAWPGEWVEAEAGQAWAALLDTTGMTIVETEMAFLREQWTHIDEVVQSGSIEATCGGGCNQKLDCAALHCSS